MANYIGVRQPISVQFSLDTTPLTTPTDLVCNREYVVVDYAIVSNAADLDLTINSVTAGVATVIGRIVDGATATWFRPTQSGVSGNTGYLAATAAVPRGSSLRLLTTDDADRASGTISILAGNRYSATTATTSFYANNTASGAQGSGATVSI